MKPRYSGSKYRMNGTVPHISILTLNVSGVNALLKRYRIAELIIIHQAFAALKRLP